MTKLKPGMFVTTDSDFWNSADEMRFFVTKGKAKPLSEELSPIIENAFVQGLLREATLDEIEKYNFEIAVEKAVKERKIIAGKNYEATIKNYILYLKEQKLKLPAETPAPEKELEEAVEVEEEEIIEEEQKKE